MTSVPFSRDNEIQNISEDKNLAIPSAGLKGPSENRMQTIPRDAINTGVEYNTEKSSITN